MTERTPVYDPKREEGFTGRGVQILQMLVDGMSKKQVAKELGIGKNTMSGHLARIRRGKLGEKGLCEAIGDAIRMGLLDTSGLPTEYDREIIDENHKPVGLILSGVDYEAIDVEMGWFNSRTSRFADELLDSIGIKTKYQLVAMAEVEKMRAGNA